MRISGLTKEPSPEDITDALQVADDYAAQIKSKTDIGWNQPTDYGTSDPADNSGLSNEMAAPFKKLLAIELLAYFGKEVTPVLMKMAKDAETSLNQQFVFVADASNPPTLPIGSGNEDDYRSAKFYGEPPANEDADYVLKGDVLNYTEDFAVWCGDEILVNVIWDVGLSGMTIANVTIGDTTSSAQLTFDQIGGYTLCMTATKTNSTDVFTVTKNFIVRNCDPVQGWAL